MARIKVLGLVWVILLVSCVPTGETQTVPSSTAASVSQVLRIGAAGLVTSPTPLGAGSGSFQLGYQLWPLYDSLTRYGANFEVIPNVARSWELSSDGLIWTFILRNDILWPDGSLLTADDVVWNLNQTVEQNWPAKSVFGTTVSARSIDKVTVAVITRQQDVTVPYGGQYLWILPRDIVLAQGMDRFSARPVGSGPYELTEFRPADRISYKRRMGPHPFRTPVIDEITIHAIPDNSQVIVGLRTNEIDIAPQRNFTAEQANQLRSLGMTVLSFPVNNISGAMAMGPNALHNTPLTDRRVRLAINYAVDRETIAKRLFGGYAQAVGQLASPGSLYWDETVGSWPYNPGLAKQLLAEAGYPDGFKLPYGIDYTPSVSSNDLVVVIQDYLRAVGISADAHSSELGTFIDKVYGRNNQSTGDILIGSTSETNGFPNRSVQGCGRPFGSPPTNTWYCNPSWDKLLDMSQAERDIKIRTDLLHQANRIQRDDIYLLYLLNMPTFVVYSDRVRGVNIPLPFLYNFDSVYRV